jgi:hypothetical protein
MCKRCFRLRFQFALLGSFYVTKKEKCDCPCPDMSESGFCSTCEHRVLTDAELGGESW